MKVVMVNDCAFVGQTLLKYLPHIVERQHIKGARGLWSKTFGLALRILRAKEMFINSFERLKGKTS